MAEVSNEQLKEILEHIIKANQANADHLSGEAREFARQFNLLAGDVDFLYEALGIDREEGGGNHDESEPSSAVNLNQDHGELEGLGDDDHPQYTTDAEATTIATREAKRIPPAMFDRPDEAAFMPVPGSGTGAAGAPGADGTPGAMGQTIPFPGADGEDGYSFIVPGPTGAPGADSTVAGPAGKDGFPAFPVDDPEQAMFVPGPPGAAGADGAPGASGSGSGTPAMMYLDDEQHFPMPVPPLPPNLAVKRDGTVQEKPVSTIDFTDPGVTGLWQTTGNGDGSVTVEAGDNPHLNSLTLDNGITFGGASGTDTMFDSLTSDGAISSYRAVRFSTSTPPDVSQCTATTDQPIGIASIGVGDNVLFNVVVRGYNLAEIASACATTAGVTLLTTDANGRFVQATAEQVPFAVAMQSGASGSNRNEFVYIIQQPTLHSHAGGSGLVTKFIDLPANVWVVDDATVSTLGATPDIVDQVQFNEAGGRTGAHASFVVPNDWSPGTALSFVIHWSTSSVTGNVRWLLSADELAAGDAASEVSSLAASGTTLADGTTSKISTLTGTLTPGAAANLIKVNLERDAAAGADTATGNARMLGMYVAYTAAVPAGATGATGSTGRDGVPGFRGEEGDQGMFMPGVAGVAGAAGADSTVPGPQGPSLPWPGPDGEDGLTFVVPGPTGAAGAPGADGAPGSGGGAAQPPGMYFNDADDGSNVQPVNAPYTPPDPASSFAAGLYGDGSDGALQFTTAGPTTAGATRSGTTYTMTRDIYATDLIVDNGVTLIGGYRIFCTGTLTNNGTISHDGAAGSASTGGSGVAKGYWSLGSGGGGAPVSGTTTVAGTAGDAQGANISLLTIGSAGGAGGNGNGGTGGVITQPTNVADTSIRRNVADALLQFGMRQSTSTAGIAGGTAAMFQYAGGMGGGGGGRTTGATATTGGAGGAGGGIIIICAAVLDNTNGTISAKGGNGAAASGAGACVTGGGGGGGGGVIYLIYHTLKSAGTITVAGGTKGAGLNGAAVAVDGTVGTRVDIVQ